MSTAGNYTASYAKAILAATRQADLVKSEQPKKIGGLTPDQMARMEREMETVQQDLKMVESSVDRAKPAICRHFTTGHFR
jgi:methylphosphotriester-DNA--protein-cysteine methyltransferase